MAVPAPPGLCVGFYPVGCGGVQDRGLSHTLIWLSVNRVPVVLMVYAL